MADEKKNKGGRPKGRKNKTSTEKLADLLDVNVPSFLVKDAENLSLATSEDNEIDVVAGPVDQTGGVPAIRSTEDDIITDYKVSRSQYYECLKAGNRLLDGITRIAEEGEHPRAFEVAVNALKIVAEINKDRMELQVTMKDILEERKTVNHTTNIQAENVNMTTDELLQRMMKQEKKEEEIDGDVIDIEAKEE